MMSSREEHKGAGKPSADARISHHGHLPNYSARAWWGRVVTGDFSKIKRTNQSIPISWLLPVW